MGEIRGPNSDEVRLMAALSSAVPFDIRKLWPIDFSVAHIDRSLGRLSFFVLLPGEVLARRSVRAVSELKFIDADNVGVYVILFLDENDKPAEVEVWKGDDSQVIAIPRELPPAFQT